MVLAVEQVGLITSMMREERDEAAIAVEHEALITSMRREIRHEAEIAELVGFSERTVFRYLNPDEQRLLNKYN